MKPQLKDEYQRRVDLAQSKPYVLIRIWDWDSEKDTWKEAEIARSKTLNGIRAFARMKGIPTGTGEFRIEEETVEFTDGWYPHFNQELIEEL